MKTPMQQMADFISEILTNPPEYGCDYVLSEIQDNVDEMIEMEKEVIDDAYLCGLNRGVEFQQSQEMGVLCEWPSDRDYYEETFNTKKNENTNSKVD